MSRTFILSVILLGSFSGGNVLSVPFSRKYMNSVKRGLLMKLRDDGETTEESLSGVRFRLCSLYPSGSSAVQCATWDVSDYTVSMDTMGNDAVERAVPERCPRRRLDNSETSKALATTCDPPTQDAY